MSRTSATAPQSMTSERCVVCDDVVARIEMVIDGQALTMVSCTSCDRRTWSRDGAVIDLRQMLADLSDHDLRFVRLGRAEDRSEDDDVRRFTKRAVVPQV